MSIVEGFPLLTRALRERELKALRQRVSLQDDDTVVPGGSDAQVQVQASSILNRRDAADHSGSTTEVITIARLEDHVSRLSHKMLIIEAGQQELGGTVAVTNARVDHLAKANR